MSAPLFHLGQIVATPGALSSASGPFGLMPYIARHAAGDWGCVDPEDAAMNTAAITEGLRILSAYPIDPSRPCPGYGENCLWVITEADRSVTTVLLPKEY